MESSRSLRRSIRARRQHQAHSERPPPFERAVEPRASGNQSLSELSSFFLRDFMQHVSRNFEEFVCLTFKSPGTTAERAKFQPTVQRMACAYLWEIIKRNPTHE